MRTDEAAGLRARLRRRGFPSSARLAPCARRAIFVPTPDRSPGSDHRSARTGDWYTTDRRRQGGENISLSESVRSALASTSPPGLPRATSRSLARHRARRSPSLVALALTAETAPHHRCRGGYGPPGMVCPCAALFISPVRHSASSCQWHPRATRITACCRLICYHFDCVAVVRHLEELLFQRVFSLWRMSHAERPQGHRRRGETNPHTAASHENSMSALASDFLVVE